MADRLISADAFIAEMNDRIENAIKWGVNAIADRNDEIKLRAEQAVAAFCEASLTAKKMPTVDAIPVVRCKECQFHEHDEPGMVWCPNVIGSWIEEDGYCSMGERRESTMGQVKVGLTQKNVGNALESLEEMEDAKDLGYEDR